MLLAPALAPATVEEQRKRLPPPARDCADPITGEWMGHQYLRDHWNRFELHIRRVSPGSPELTGEITSFVWEVPPEIDKPPPCDGRDQFKGVMPAQGRYEEHHVSFIGQSYELTEVLCGHGRNYYPDAFSGDLSEDGSEFISINNDGFNPEIPVVFRRIKCGQPHQPTPDLPPPARPPEYATGCGGCF